ncbi:membrane protein insertase YidC [Pseudonocardia sp. KRD-182]|uniref:membrane protein insertase YidC n=1 Tax=Pseudonocardia oceani TaxID=2792013 RepID=UPI001C4A72DE|nr:membrane protein insertase YidC [Pseudonocardia oceani]MBW0111910.1 membrane protein insertase YidC [Pseudonocardia oceani]
MLDPIYFGVSGVMWVWHQLFALLLGPSSGPGWALSVVFLVLILRVVMIKPFRASVRSGRAMRALAPQMAELRARHGDDRAALARATQDLQREHGVSVVGGCLPALLQIPVFIGLLHVLHGFNRAGLSFEQNAAIANYVLPPGDVRSFLEARLFGAPLSSYLSMPQGLLDSFGAHVDRWEVAAAALPLVVVAAIATHVTARHSLARQAAPTGPAASVMRLTPWIFPLGALVGGLFFPFPVGILLYRLTDNVWTLVQQYIVRTRLDTACPPVPVAAVAAPAAAPAPIPGPRPVRRAAPRKHASGHRPSRKRGRARA